MTWNTTALVTTSISSTSGNVATGLSQLTSAVSRVNEMLTHPTALATAAWPLIASSVVQFVSTSTSAHAAIPGSTAANIIPLDTSIPQISEGYGVISQSFTPKSATSKLVIAVNGYAMCGGTALYDGAIAALFNSGSTNAIHTQWINNVHTVSVDHPMNIAMVKVETSGSTAARTYSLRIGPTTSTGAVSLNGNTGGQLLGGSSSISLTITEIA